MAKVINQKWDKLTGWPICCKCDKIAGGISRILKGQVLCLKCFKGEK